MNDFEEEETRLFISVELALESSDINKLKESLADLLKRYKKATKRFERIVDIGDKQHEALIRLNEKLANECAQLSTNIHTILDDQKSRAKNILTTRRAIYESHKKELTVYKSSYNELQNLIAEKESLSYKYAMLQQDYQEVKKITQSTHNDDNGSTKETKQFSKASENDIESTIEELKTMGLEDELFARTQNFVDMQIINGQMDSVSFAKRFFKMLKVALEKGFLKKIPTAIDVEQLSVYILKKYTEDILSVVADMIIKFASEKTQKAFDFISSYDGSVGYDVDGQAIQRPKIIDDKNNLWLATSVVQNRAHMTSLQKQVEEKIQSIDVISVKMAEDQEEISKYQNLVQDYKEIKPKDMTLEDQNELVRCETIIKQKKLELEIQKKILAAEKNKLALAKESLAPVNLKHETIILAFVKSLMASMSKKAI